jgi:chaperonin GroES
MKNIKPLGNRVLIKRSKAQSSKGGILLPDSAQEKPKEGEVIAVGPGKRDEDGKVIQMNVKEGDKVLFTTYAGTEIKNSDGEADYLIMAEDDLLGILVK